ncbi:uncharacterized protein BDZ99DRAFT_76641 [Mytilinidion resinicola]|uniref:Uncharacterized protein n=1 Tax=Mytilinidion resinicola TaxID=574789 RepID=A0A6A6YEI7_9PEZI|nr:uncharacterized protein BDZ99DRAFT_76641 [Mytilinidion resinicola]KAF2807232.1 hypothetical protein BDZ99DRAFT_76641 [Mytilinidion resinicola]
MPCLPLTFLFSFLKGPLLIPGTLIAFALYDSRGLICAALTATIARRPFCPLSQLTWSSRCLRPQGT